MPVRPMIPSDTRSVFVESRSKSAANCACCRSTNCIVRCISSGDIGSNSTRIPPSRSGTAIMPSSSIDDDEQTMFRGGRTRFRPSVEWLKAFCHNHLSLRAGTSSRGPRSFPSAIRSQVPMIKRFAWASTLAIVFTIGPALDARSFGATQSPPAAAPALPRGVERVTSVEGITEYRLSNGLRVLLFPDLSKQTITLNVTYQVGSRHENYGETGMAHLLEHMLFKGSPKHTNIPQELTVHGTRPNGST